MIERYTTPRLERHEHLRAVLGEAFAGEALAAEDDEEVEDRGRHVLEDRDGDLKLGLVLGEVVELVVALVLDLAVPNLGGVAFLVFLGELVVPRLELVEAPLVDPIVQVERDEEAQEREAHDDFGPKRQVGVLLDEHVSVEEVAEDVRRPMLAPSLFISSS